MFEDAYGIDLHSTLVYRVMKKGRSETCKRRNDANDETFNDSSKFDNNDKDDKQAKKDRYSNCIALGKQLSSFAREDNKMFNMIMPELSKLVNKCALMAKNAECEQESTEDDDNNHEAEDEWNGTICDGSVREQPSKRAKTSLN